MDHGLAHADDLQRFVQWCGGVVRRVDFVHALVAGQAKGHARAPQAARNTHGRPVLVLLVAVAGHVRVVRREIAAELEAARTTAGDGERWLRTPVAGRVGAVGVRHVERLDVDVDGRLVP